MGQQPEKTLIKGKSPSVKLMSRRENKELTKTNFKNMGKTMQELQHIGFIRDLRPKYSQSTNINHQVPLSNYTVFESRRPVQLQPWLTLRILLDRQIFLKDFLTVMMVYSSFKTACFNWSHVNSPKTRILCLPLEGG